MKVFLHCYDNGKPDETRHDECYLDNRKEPIVRKGGNLFLNEFEIEDSFWRSHLVDPSRSLVSPVLKHMDWGDGEPNWSICACLSVLIADMGIDRWHPVLSDQVAYWTMFPDGVAEALSNSFMKDSSLLAKHGDVVRVLNNPFFYKDPNANERRLVEIAEDNGLRFALDRISVIPPPETLAREIALLNHGIRDPENVESVRALQAASIAETMSDWGLEPTVPAAESLKQEKGDNE